MKHRSICVLSLAAIGALSGAAHAQQTIVGKWAIRGQCAKPLSVIDIAPKGLSGEDFYCEFATVARKGDTVTWTGRCNFSENGWEKSSAIAHLRGKRLYYRFAGLGWNGPFDRCAR